MASPDAKFERRVSAVMVQDVARFHSLGVKSVLHSVCPFILGAQLFERFAFFTIFSSLQVFLIAYLNLPIVSATAITAAFGALSYFMPIIGLWYAEDVAGHYRTLRISYVFYIFGLLICAVGVYPDLLDVSVARAVVFFGLFVGVGIGNGLHNVNIVVFGAEQFDLNDEDHLKQRDQYFGWVFWGLNLGSTLAFVYVAHLALTGEAILGLSAKYGFFAAYCIALFSILMSFGIFNAFQGRFLKKFAEGCAFTLFWEPLTELSENSKCIRWFRYGVYMQFAAAILSIASYVSPTDYWIRLGLTLGALIVSFIGLFLMSVLTPYAKCSTAMAETEEDPLISAVFAVLRLVPMFVSSVMFWIMQSQMFTTFVNQGCRTNQDLWGYTLTPPQLTLFSTLTLILTSKLIKHCLQRIEGFHNILRISIGLVIGSTAMFLAGGMEHVLGNAAVLEDAQSTCGPEFQVKDVSILMQMPQFVLLGLSEAMVLISTMDYCFLHAPAPFQSVVMIFHYVSGAIGYNLSGTLSSTYALFISGELTHQNMEYHFFGLAGLGLVNLLFFLVRTRGYASQKPIDESDDENFQSVVSV